MCVCVSVSGQRSRYFLSPISILGAASRLGFLQTFPKSGHQVLDPKKENSRLREDCEKRKENAGGTSPTAISRPILEQGSLFVVKFFVGGGRRLAGVGFLPGRRSQQIIHDKVCVCVCAHTHIHDKADK